MMHSHDTGTLTLPTFDLNGRPCEGAKKKAPLFLQKTFDMITSCDSNLACWADDGLSFIVKDPDQVASEVIPQYFKHNKFSSFVRQLNFYGFRKIKVDPIRLSLNGAEVESKHWRFKHAKFQRGRADLLGEVRRPSENSTPDHEEVENMKGEISRLNDQVRFLTSELHSLASTMKQFLRKRGLEHQQSAPNLGQSTNSNDLLKRQRSADVSFQGFMPNSNSSNGNIAPVLVQSQSQMNHGVMTNVPQNNTMMYGQPTARNISADSNSNHRNYSPQVQQHQGHHVQPTQQQQHHHEQQQHQHQQHQSQNQQRHRHKTNGSCALDSDLLFDVFVDEPIDSRKNPNKNGSFSNAIKLIDDSMTIDTGMNACNNGSMGRQMDSNVVSSSPRNSADDALVSIPGFSGMEDFFRKNSNNITSKS